MVEIDPTTPFSLYALCSVSYEGRACSTLECGRYLVLYKADGTFLVHGGMLSNACNYQGPGSKLTIDNNTLVCHNKKETINVKIIEIIHYQKLVDWSESRPVVGRTEKELVLKIQNNWASYFPGSYTSIQREFPTPLGPVDLYGISDNFRVIVEVKRRKATLKDVTQLRRYVEQYNDVVGYLAAPLIGAKALRYLEEQGLKWLPVDFDSV